jgi:hypothetical protein
MTTFYFLLNDGRVFESIESNITNAVEKLANVLSDEYDDFLYLFNDITHVEWYESKLGDEPCERPWLLKQYSDGVIKLNKESTLNPLMKIEEIPNTNDIDEDYE